ncbi:hypothetical protein FH608_040465 [Nonomuraea phyllanthi]|uniref:Uncharacterized protein n=1 Tax=Nonomuraea phyllanthi TaxID=2219224 RepID=A0A5C4VIW7_9ACTN|nr:hypothetical protein FH608_040465 [Nonomuraea phyllanthi]
MSASLAVSFDADVGDAYTPSVLGRAAAVFGAGAAVAQFQVGELATRGAGDGAVEAVPVKIGAARLGIGVLAFLMDDDAHALWASRTCPAGR